MKKVSLNLTWVAALLFLVSSTLAGTNQTVPTDDKSGIHIKISQAFDTQPRSGYAPITITIGNDTTSPHTWDFSFQSPGRNNGDNGNSMSFLQSFTVPSQTERSFDVLVPLALINIRQYVGNQCSLQVNGYGVSVPFISLAIKGRSVQNGRLCIGYSGVIDGKAGSDLSTKLDSGSGSGPNNLMSISSISLNQLPGEWRALAGFDMIWFTEQEWSTLPPATRLAFTQWVETGGILYRSSVGEKTSQRFQPRERIGFGEVRDFLIPSNGAELADFIIEEARQNPVGLANQLTNEYRSIWPDKDVIPPYKPNSVLLISIIVLFGVLVGPVNFFVFSKKEKRHRIFWMTPALSIGGTLLVGLTILIQDGFNGWGRRVAFVCLLPEQNSEIVLQEQATKTALLTSGNFAVDSTALLMPIPLNDLPREFSTDGKNYSGDYFNSRRIQGQWLTAVRPSRARVQIVNASEVAAGQPPKILSSIAATLDDLYWVNEKLDVWHTTNVGPGKTMALSRVTSIGLGKDFDKTIGPRLKAMRQRMLIQPDYFYATARAPKGAMIPTLSSIQWRDDRVLYLGPVTP